MDKNQIEKWIDSQTLDKNIASKATKKGHKHDVNSSAKPSKGKRPTVAKRKARKTKADR